MEKKAVNLFANKKVKETASKKPDKKTFEAAELENKIAEFIRVKNLIDEHTSHLKMIEGDIKERGKHIFMEQYQETKLRPENFKIKDETGASCLFIVMDKYTSVDEGKAEILRACNLLSEDTTYKVNPELVDKYGEILSELIMNCQEISDDDKGNLITGELQYSVKKGSLDRLIQYPNPTEIFELINPICSIKK